MKNHSKTRQLSLSAIFIAIGVLFPIVFHFVIAGSGPIFLPMHIPVLISGFFLSPIFAFIVGILTPILSSLLTQMPPLMPILPIMMTELSLAAIVISFLVKIKKGKVISQLLVAMIIARIGSGITIYIMMNMIKIRLDPIIYLKGSLITGLPGILIQLILIPIIIKRIKPGI
ncbi:MAG: ECF transporter S component [Candidatus Muiribacterium halophilum]|uniref:ECF transporter S component n=1 Tax=Muiribacterium halophilum TaxID=2053465 RepID=A0A2N5ZHZ1_MUIH1|nr:MAG: ECF transporter S component [Candidatus Muirbacterium halophilum]